MRFFKCHHWQLIIELQAICMRSGLSVHIGRHAKSGTLLWGAGGSRGQRPPPQRPPRRLPSGVVRDSDVVDVWFDTRESQTERRRRGS